MKILFRALLLAVLLAPSAVMYRISASTARFEVQAAADAAALAGAAQLLTTGGDKSSAMAEAQAVAHGNSVNGRPAELPDGDIAINVPEGIVKVRTHGRALPFSLPFLRFEVTAEAAAEARGYSEDRPEVPPRMLRLIR